MKRKKYSRKTNIWFTDEASTEPSEVADLGMQLNVVFPRSYIDIASIYNGGCPDRNIFDAGAHEESVFEYLLTVPNDFLETYARIKPRLLDGIIPFAIDPFGNAICFDYRKGGQNCEPEIVFWDHEAPAKSDESIIPLAHSFDEFTEEKLYSL